MRATTKIRAGLYELCAHGHRFRIAEHDRRDWAVYRRAGWRWVLVRDLHATKREAIQAIHHYPARYTP